LEEAQKELKELKKAVFTDENYDTSDLRTDGKAYDTKWLINQLKITRALEIEDILKLMDSKNSDNTTSKREEETTVTEEKETGETEEGSKTPSRKASTSEEGKKGAKKGKKGKSREEATFAHHKKAPKKDKKPVDPSSAPANF